MGPAGISSVLAKPFNPRELLALVRRILNARSPGDVRDHPAGEPPAREKPPLSQRLMALVQRIIRACWRRGR